MGEMADAFLDQVIDQENNVSNYIGGLMSFEDAMSIGVLDEQGFLSNAKTGFYSNDRPAKERPMATAKRTRTKGVKGGKTSSKKKEVDISQYVNYIPEGETIEVSDRFLDYVFLLYGESGSGKTSTLAQAPGAYTIQCDPNRRGLKIRQTNVPNNSLKTMKSSRSTPTPWEIIVATVDAILDDDSVGTVIFDNFKLVYQHASNHYCMKNGVDALKEMEDFGVSWNNVDSMYMDLFESIVVTGRGLGLITHQKENEIELPSGRMFTQIQPDLSGRPFQAVRQMTDFVFYLGKSDAGGRELTIRHDKNDIFYKCCTDEDQPHFFSPEGVPVKKISMGNSPQQAWKNLMLSWDNKVACSAPVKKVSKKKKRRSN